MNREQIKKKVTVSLNQQLHTKGYITTVDTLLDIGVLSKQNYDLWRKGNVDYLERVCTCNLSQLSFIAHLIRSYAVSNELKKSMTVYMSYGKNKHKLRFSKSNQKSIEDNYASHYVKQEKK